MLAQKTYTADDDGQGGGYNRDCEEFGFWCDIGRSGNAVPLSSAKARCLASFFGGKQDSSAAVSIVSTKTGPFWLEISISTSVHFINTFLREKQDLFDKCRNLKSN